MTKFFSLLDKHTEFLVLDIADINVSAGRCQPMPILCIHRACMRYSIFLFLALEIYTAIYCSIRFTEGTYSESIKGTVSRDFPSPVFFIKQLLLVPLDMPRNDFESDEYSWSYSYSKSTLRCIQHRGVNLNLLGYLIFSNINHMSEGC